MTRARWWRLGALAALVVGLLVVAKTTGLLAYLEKDRLRALVESAGVWGPPLFIAAFCAGELLHVPGLAFVAVAVFSYGPIAGGALAYVGAVASFTLVFAIVRGIGGKPLGEIKWAFARRTLAHLEDRPIRTVALLRLVLWMSPQINYVLALSNVRFTKYVVGSALGLALPMVGIVFFWDRLLN